MVTPGLLDGTRLEEADNLHLMSLHLMVNHLLVRRLRQHPMRATRTIQILAAGTRLKMNISEREAYVNGYLSRNSVDPDGATKALSG